MAFQEALGVDEAHSERAAEFYVGGSGLPICPAAAHCALRNSEISGGYFGLIAGNDPMSELAMSRSEHAGKVYIVTGGAKGLGRGIVRTLAANGANLAIVGRDDDAARMAAHETQFEHGVVAEAIRADVAKAGDCERIVERAFARFGAVHGLVNNAALFALVALIDVSPEETARMIDTNTKGPLFLSCAFARKLFESGDSGAIVNVSSIAGARPAPGCGLYSASKAALDSLTKTMALEWTPRGLRVNGVAPGHIETDGVRADFEAGRLDRARMLASIPTRRIAEPGDIAEAVMFLLSERARHITGTTLTVDGGEVM